MQRLLQPCLPICKIFSTVQSPRLATPSDSDRGASPLPLPNGISPSSHFACLAAACAACIPFRGGRGSGGPPPMQHSANADWASYLGDKQRSLYSPLDQINHDNVTQLKVAWIYDTGDKGEYAGQQPRQLTACSTRPPPPARSWPSTPPRASRSGSGTPLPRCRGRQGPPARPGLLAE